MQRTLKVQESSRPKIVVTPGDPAGIGPEVIAKALADPEIAGLADWRTWDRPLPQGLRMGEINAQAGEAALHCVRQAVELCLDGKADAMVTGPLNKEAVALTYPGFTGHTEYIAQLCGRKTSRMLLANERLAVIHVSTHVGLKKACALTTQRIHQTIQFAAAALPALGKPDGRIAVCGLNPHAGEGGLFGDEEEKAIKPAIDKARAAGIDCSGPFPADTLFLKAWRGAFALVVAMYHDQGHIPMKLLAFEQTVNVTLGLPIIRTSVDHGTGFDIAGKDLADPTNMKAAMRMAALMARQR